MSNILTAKVRIRGTRPLLMHRFGPDAIPLEKKEKTGVAGHDPQEWRKSCMLTKDGQLYIEGSYVFGTMRAGAKYTSKKRSSYMQDVSATLQVGEDRITLDRYFPGFPNGHKCDPATAEPPAQDPDEPVYLDVRSVVNPSTRARNVRYRVAASPGWVAEFTLMWDRTIVPRDIMHAIAIDAGRLVGIGSGRAIGMGRFEVEGFEIVE